MSDDLNQPFSRLNSSYTSGRAGTASTITVPDQPVPGDPAIREEVERYTQWLQLNNRLSIPQQRLQAYQNEALTVKKVKQKEIRPFAPFQEKTSALKVITAPQVAVLALLAIAIVAGFFYFHLTMLTIMLGAITVLYICGFTASSLMATNSFRSDAGESIDEEIIKTLDKRRVEWPTYTILCPLYKETRIAPQFVRAIKALDYPQDKLQVLFLTEENDNDTRMALYSLQLPSNFNVLIVPKGTPQTKPRACNFGLLQAKGQFIVIFDAEDKPEPYQLKKAVLTFANHGAELACVQAKLNYYNSAQNILTRLFTAEYSTWFDIMLPGLQRTGFSLPLGGTSNHFRTEVLRALGGWDAFNVTEDCDLGLRISQYGLETAVLDSTTYEEATSQVKVWLFQRSRWIKGYLQTYLVHMRRPVQALQKGRFRSFFSLQVIVGAWTFVLLVNPIMWLLTVCYILFRPVSLYQMLFPGPVLYIGAFCLIFGNFFYIYTHFLGCLRRREYELIKWVFLLPLYWVLMSISAYIALYQLIVKPHYWEKTQHGNHLQAIPGVQVTQVATGTRTAERIAYASMPTVRVNTQITEDMLRYAATTAIDPETPTQKTVAIRGTIATQIRQNEQIQSKKQRRVLVDPWLIAMILIASIISTLSTIYSFDHHYILLYGDSYFHLRVARRLVDSATPGIGQFGTTWLPLPHILMFPFALNDYLWRTGLAGSIPAMICYVISATYLFLTGKRLTGNNWASFVGTFLFILNPNVLYLQSSPLSELVCIATMTVACYYFLAWVQNNHLRYLIWAAAGTFLATLARFDGWALFAAFVLLIPLIGLIKRQRLRQIEANFLTFLTLSSLGIILWLIYNTLLEGNPFYFETGPYSSKVQTMDLHNSHAPLYTYHNLWEAIRFYSLNVIDTIGPIPCLVALVAFTIFLMRKRLKPEVFGMIAFLSPFVFYVVSLYTGDVGLLTPGIFPNATDHTQLFNDRFGSEMVVPVAIFLITLLDLIGKIVRKRSTSLTPRFWSIVVYSLCTIAVLAQSYFIASNGIVALDDGLYGVSCEPNHPVNNYLAAHYNGGLILEELFSSPVDGSEGNFDFKNIIWEGSYQIWPKVLAHPSMADWIIVNPTDPTDLVAHDIKLESPEFLAQFTLVVQEKTGLRLYHKKGLPPLPNRAIPSYLLINRPYCGTGKYPPNGGIFNIQ